MDGHTQSYLFKERLLKCEPIDLGRFVVNLRERHLDYWAPSDIHPRERNSKRSTYYQWCALPTRRAMVTDTHSPYTLQGEVPKCMLLDLQDQEEVPRDVIRSVARFRLCAHTLRIETVTWTHNTSPTCDLLMLMMYRMSNTSFSTAPIHTWSLSEGHMLPFFLQQA